MSVELVEFERRFRKTDNYDCWLWGDCSPEDYAAHHPTYKHESGRTEVAQRASYRFYVGEIPEGLLIDHICMVKGCVCPYHLEPVSHQDNGRRCVPTRKFTDMLKPWKDGRFQLISHKKQDDHKRNAIFEDVRRRTVAFNRQLFLGVEPDEAVRIVMADCPDFKQGLSISPKFRAGVITLPEIRARFAKVAA